MKRALALSWSSVAMIASMACGGSVGSTATTTDAAGDDASDASALDAVTLSDGTSPGSDASVDTAIEASSPLTLDNVCDRYSTAVCSSDLQKCCTDRIHDYSATGCKTAINFECNAAVGSVRAGTTSWDPTKFDACIAAWSKLNASCSVFLFDFAKTYLPCEQLFPGSRALGSPCTQSSECAVGDAYTYCDTTSHTCKEVRIQAIGGSCNYTDTKTVRLCDVGGYCPLTGTPPTSCLAAKALGDSCVGGSLECGFGNVCSLTTNKCVKGLPATASCTIDLECASWSCDKTTFKCSDPYVSVASSAVCTGHP
jgi:hypothetical protein